MKKTRAAVQDWDAIKDQPPSRSPSCPPEQSLKERRHSDIIELKRCRSCSCDACLDKCAHCLSKCVRSSIDCCHGCISCSKGLRQQGWRKWCLFGLISILVLIVVINMALTLWIMKIMEFSHNGMGPLRIYSGGVELTGTSYVLDHLIASSIKSKQGQSLSLNSYRNFTLKASDDEGLLENLVFIDNDTFTCRSNNLVIEDPDGKVLFSSSSEQVVVGAKELMITGEGGILFNHSVVTPNIESPTGKSLKIESLTRAINISSGGDMILESKAGGISGETLKDIHFKSRSGTIKIDSRKIFMPNLIVAHASRRPKKISKINSRIYQVCVCENGRLFLARPNGVCEMYDVASLCQ